MEINKKIIEEGLNIKSKGKKYYSNNKQNIIITESQLDNIIESIYDYENDYKKLFDDIDLIQVIDRIITDSIEDNKLIPFNSEDFEIVIEKDGEDYDIIILNISHDTETVSIENLELVDSSYEDIELSDKEKEYFINNFSDELEKYLENTRIDLDNYDDNNIDEPNTIQI